MDIIWKGKGREGGVNGYNLAMCGSRIKFPTLPPLVTSRRKTHRASMGQEVGNFIRMGT